MKENRPKDALRSTSESGRMRTNKEGGWVRYSDYEAWRNYALGLESCLCKSIDNTDKALAMIRENTKG